MDRREDGYTLVELVVVMLIFSLVMTLISVSFKRIVASSRQITKSVETDIGGLIGLELLRYDLELAGFGLPWSLPTGLTYHETAIGEMVDGYPETAATLYNDEPSAAPVAYKSGNGAGYNGSDYLVLKGSALGMNDTSRNWSYLNYTSPGVLIKPSKSDVELTPGWHDRTIVLKSSVRSGTARRELVTDGAGSNVFTLVFDTPFPDGFRPKSKEDQYLVYGVAKKDDSHPLLYPYNRSDYYISRTDNMTSSCAGHTGVLYKTTMDHSGGTTPYPILDCVADLQVVFMMATGSDGVLVPHDDISGYPAAGQRDLLKEVRLYVLAQQGQKERGYSFPMLDQEKAIEVGDRTWTKGDFLANGWLNYHWKVYTIVVQPKNL